MTFPKTQQARCLLTNAPPGVDEKQMKELQVLSDSAISPLSYYSIPYLGYRFS